MRVRAIGHILFTLKDVRVKADYKLHQTFERSEAEECVIRVKAVFEKVAGLCAEIFGEEMSGP